MGYCSKEMLFCSVPLQERLRRHGHIILHFMSRTRHPGGFGTSFLHLLGLKHVGPVQSPAEREICMNAFEKEAEAHRTFVRFYEADEKIQLADATAIFNWRRVAGDPLPERPELAEFELGKRGYAERDKMQIDASKSAEACEKEAEQYRENKRTLRLVRSQETLRKLAQKKVRTFRSRAANLRKMSAVATADIEDQEKQLRIAVERIQSASSGDWEEVAASLRLAIEEKRRYIPVVNAAAEAYEAAMRTWDTVRKLK